MFTMLFISVGLGSGDDDNHDYDWDDDDDRDVNDIQCYRSNCHDHWPWSTCATMINWTSLARETPSTTISSNNCLTTPFPLHNDHNHLPLCRLVSSLDGAGGRPTRRPPRRKGTAEQQQQQQQQQSAADRRVVILSSAPTPQRRGADRFHLQTFVDMCVQRNLR